MKRILALGTFLAIYSSAFAGERVGTCYIDLTQKNGAVLSKTVKLENKAVGEAGFPYLAAEKLLGDFGTGEPLMFSASRAGRGIIVQISTPTDPQAYPPQVPTFKLLSVSTDGFVKIDHIDQSNPYVTTLKVLCQRK